MIWCEHL